MENLNFWIGLGGCTSWVKTFRTQVTNHYNDQSDIFIFIYHWPDKALQAVSLMWRYLI